MPRGRRRRFRRENEIKIQERKDERRWRGNKLALLSSGVRVDGFRPDKIYGRCGQFHLGTLRRGRWHRGGHATPAEPVVVRCSRVCK